MGGQMQGAGNFGFYVDSALERGHSRPNATYASPSLSSEQVFEVDAVEAWLLAPPEEEEEQQRQGKASILTKARRSCGSAWHSRTLHRSLAPTLHVPLGASDAAVVAAPVAPLCFAEQPPTPLPPQRDTGQNQLPLSYPHTARPRRIRRCCSWRGWPPTTGRRSGRLKRANAATKCCPLPGQARVQAQATNLSRRLQASVRPAHSFACTSMPSPRGPFTPQRGQMCSKGASGEGKRLRLRAGCLTPLGALGYSRVERRGATTSGAASGGADDN